MMSKFTHICLFTFFILSISSCLKEESKGRQMISNSAREWQAYQSNQTLSFHNSDATVQMSFKGSNRKSVFNEVADCKNTNAIQEVCDLYLMECDNILFNTLGNQFVFNYSIEKQLVKGELVDCLSFMLQEKDFPMLKGQVYLHDNQVEMNSALEFFPQTMLNERKFENVYKLNNSATGQSVYLTKSQGIIAFQTNETMWSLMN